MNILQPDAGFLCTLWLHNSLHALSTQQMKQTTAIILFLLSINTTSAQHHEPHEKAEMWKGKPIDSATLYQRTVLRGEIM